MAISSIWLQVLRYGTLTVEDGQHGALCRSNRLPLALGSISAYSIGGYLVLACC